MKLNKLRSDFELILEVGNISSINNYNTTSPNSTRVKLSPLHKKSYAISGSHHLNKQANTSISPNNCPPNLDFRSKAEIVNIFAAKIQICVRGRNLRRASKQ